MTKNIHNRTYIQGIKALILLLLVGLCFVDYGFAAEISTSAQIGEGLQFITKFLGWARIIFADLAGKLMTNERVYGGWLHMDVHLRKWWNVFKNFANFALGTAFLFFILVGLFAPTSKYSIYGGGGGDFQKKIIKLFVAGLLIQSSRFLMGALIDISNIVVATVGSIPAQILSQDSILQRNYMEANSHIINKRMIITYNPDADDIIKIERETFEAGSAQKVIDLLLPSNESLSGPLMFMGLSIFRFQDYTWHDAKALDDEKGFGDYLVYMGISWLIIVIFTIALIFLVLFNIARILALRIIIPFLPIGIIIWALDLKDLFKGGTDKLGDMGIKNILNLIFKPVIYVLYLTLMLIFLTGVYGVIRPDKKQGLTTSLNEQGTVTLTEDVNQSKLEADGFKLILKSAQTTFAGLFIYIITLALMYFLVKLSVTKSGTSIKFVDDFMNKTWKSIDNIATSVGFIPVPGVVGHLSPKVIKDSISTIKTHYDFSKERRTQTQGIEKMFGFSSDLDKLKSSAERGETGFPAMFSSYLHDNMALNDSGRVLSSPHATMLSTWLSKNKAGLSKVETDNIYNYVYKYKTDLNTKFPGILFKTKNKKVYVSKKSTTTSEQSSNP